MQMEPWNVRGHHKGLDCAPRSGGALGPLEGHHASKSPVGTCGQKPDKSVLQSFCSREQGGTLLSTLLSVLGRDGESSTTKAYLDVAVW